LTFKEFSNLLLLWRSAVKRFNYLYPRPKSYNSGTVSSDSAPSGHAIATLNRRSLLLVVSQCREIPRALAGWKECGRHQLHAGSYDKPPSCPFFWRRHLHKRTPQLHVELSPHRTQPTRGGLRHETFRQTEDNRHLDLPSNVQ